MPRVEIRDLSGDEALEAMYPLTAYAFGATPPLRDKAEFITTGRLRPAGRSTVAFEDGRPAAVVSALPMTQNVRGGLFGASAILGVASDPATRRQGYVRDAMAAMLRATRDDRQPFSALYPFRESFYERMGYVTLSRGHLLKVAPANLTPLLKRELGGRVERLSIADGYDLARAYALGVRQRTHGMAVFDRPEKEHALHHNDYWIALAFHGREVIGAMPYSIRHEPGTGNVLKGPRFLYDTSQARYLLLQWIARHADQVAQAEIRVAAFERPDTWLTDARSSVEFSGTPMRARGRCWGDRRHEG